MTARFLVGDVFDHLTTLETGSVDLVVTSPPFLALRSYLPADHPDKDREIGSEATPAEFIDVMLRVTQELRRVLAPHGSIAVELGDTYAGGGAVDNRADENGLIRRKPHENQPTFNRGSGAGSPTIGDGWPLSKSKALIAELYRVALAYGVNPLTGAESPAGRWRVRNVVTWVRPNPPVGALGDKWRPATSDLVVACTSPKRYWDDLATRKPISANTPVLVESRGEKGPVYRSGMPDRVTGSAPGGAPLLDWWEIPPGGYKGSHYAVFPEELVIPCVQAMCPPKVCRTCGQPSRRIVEQERLGPQENTAGRNGRMVQEAGLPARTIGWSDCGHGGPMDQHPSDTGNWRPGLILDPFAGSGTTLAVATGYGHDAIGIDLDPRNAELALERVGPFLLEVEA